MSSTIPRKYRDAFVARVKKARTDAGYTQRAVAMLLGVEKSTYNNYELGRGKEPPLLRPLPSSNGVACDRQRNPTKSRSSKTTKTEAAVKSLRRRPEARRLRAFANRSQKLLPGGGPAPQ